MNIDIKKIPLDDAKTWEFIGTGKTKGIFQCESPLVQKWLEKIKPRNIWELSIVIAGVRPGSLKSGMMDDYLDYRNGTREVESFGHPTIDEVLGSTDHALFFQEQVMVLGDRLAWSNLEPKPRSVKVDTLRKAIGKKNQAKILEIGNEFVSGCLGNGISEDVANKLFEIIKNCGRYAFNLSHSISYAHIAYKTAFLKTHYPLHFYATYLSYAQHRLDKWMEISDLIKEMQYFDIPITIPNINKKNIEFAISDKSISYGLSHIKFLSHKSLAEISKIPPIKDWRQFVILAMTKDFGNLNSRAIEALCKSGAFQDLKISRKSLLSLFNFLGKLTKGEIKKFVDIMTEFSDVKDLPDIINRLLANKVNVNRQSIIRSELALLDLNQYDDPAFVEASEKEFLGFAITSTSMDKKDIVGERNCYECGGINTPGTKTSVAAILDQIIYTETKTGKNPGQKMARLFIRDSTGSIDNLPCFPEQFSEFGDYLMEKCSYVFNIYRNKNGWVLNSVTPI